MRTLGVDLAAQPKSTAIALIKWGPERATVVSVRIDRSDSQLIEEMLDSDYSGIDCPVGWPQEMARAVQAYTDDDVWPGVEKTAFRYRRTDLAVIETVKEQTGKPLYPLSVSTDRIALAAWRVAGLRETLSERTGKRFDRAGADGVFEVYPAASLLLWDLGRRGYKARDAAGRAARDQLVRAIEATAPWLEWGEQNLRDRCVEIDHALDAVVASLVTRAAALDLTHQPTDPELAQVEGWIHLPKAGSLGQLLGSTGRS